MSEWKKVKLGEITESCLGKMLDAAKNRGEYKPYLANLNVRWGSFDTDNLSLMRFEENEDERYGIKYGDLIICEGGEPGRCAIWKEQLPDMKIQKALHRVRPKDGLVDNFYLFYWFLLAGKCNWIDQYCTGATIKHLPGQKLKEVIVDLPPIEVQHRIATILSRYDTLIENYQKQIKLLEEAAQRLYKEWFVELRFPGHENTKMVDGLPEGWERKKIDDVCVSISSGSTPSRNNKNYWENGTIKWVKTKELQDGWILDTEEYITQDGYNNSSTKMFPENTVLMAIYASPTLGRLGVLATECCCNQAALGLIADEAKISWQWLFWKLYELRDEFNSIARGAGQQNISGIVVKNKVIVVPDKPIIDAFTSAVSNLFEKQKNISCQIRLLTEARDRLMPRLMGGEMEVNNKY